MLLDFAILNTENIAKIDLFILRQVSNTWIKINSTPGNPYNDLPQILNVIIAVY